MIIHTPTGPSPWQYFSMKELSCQCGCGLMNMQPSFMQRTVQVRRQLGWWFVGISASRCPLHNNNVGKTGYDGPHTYGRAIDVEVLNSHKRFQLIDALLKAGFKRIGIAKSFIHWDDLTPKDNPKFTEQVTWLY